MAASVVEVRVLSRQRTAWAIGPGDNCGMTQDELKALVGQAAIAHVQPGSIVGVGTGSTVNHFIDALARMPVRVAGAVSSSVQSTERLRKHGIPVLEANEVTGLGVYVDGADEIDGQGCMIKGGGAALTREKIVADLAEKFVCIADESKKVDVLGRFPLPVEVIQIAVPQVMRRFVAMGGQPSVRAGVLTDNGHPIVDVRGLSITDPTALEREINQWPGVVCVGIFARHRASVCLLGTASGVQTLAYDKG
jgi:ribose 5-phosphate isomerase A